jgi:membrane fusion protein, multidrug efflux system
MSTDTTQGRERRADRSRRVMRIVLGLFALAAAVIFLVHGEPPQKVVAEPPQVLPPSEAPEKLEAIRGRGVVAPKARIEMMPEVAGKVVYVHSQLHAGGLIRANERIAEIDPSGYELAVRRAQAAVDEARAKVDLDRGAAGLRQLQGWSLDVEDKAALPAILQEPLVRQAEAALESAKAELVMAELNLSRTSVVLPYDVLIAGQTVSLGQYADAGRSLGVAYGTDAFEIEVPVSSEDLSRIGVPEGGQEREQTQATVEVRAVWAGRECVWPGKVVRATNKVDPATGMTSVVVEVPQPMEIAADRPALLPGMAVEVYFDGGRTAGGPDDAGNVGER